MEHTALYRKYRPQTFADVKNQEHIVTVLEGAIKKQQIPHAILFSGGRGTGKTTLARIFAHEVGTDSIDIYEIDAASNRGIDDIRELKDAVNTQPYKSKYKVYIIDEVHMLTKEAFNALLKTLEEPPSHVLFMLATTEEEKLLDTVRSRCQVFRLRTPVRSVLAEMVKATAKQEGYTINNNAADIIATAADGSFRDALGILQKVMLSVDSDIDADTTASIVGAPKTELVLEILHSLIEGDTSRGLQAVGRSVEQHVDMKLFIQNILDVLRAILLVRYQPDNAKELFAGFDDVQQEFLLTCAKEHNKTLNSHTQLVLLNTAKRVVASPVPPMVIENSIITLTDSADKVS